MPESGGGRAGARRIDFADMPVKIARETRGLPGRVKYGFVMNEFLEACGLDGRLRLDLDGPGGPERRALDQPFAVIGRNAGADLTLSDRRVSRRHAYLQAIAGEVFCVDLGSRAGVYWGRHRRRSGWVDREQGVVIKPFRIRQGKAGGAAGGSEGSDRPENPLAKQSADVARLERRGPGILARGGRAILLEDEPPADPGGKVPRLSGPADGPRDLEVSLQPPAHADGSLGRRPARSRRDRRQRGERPLSADRRRR